MIEFNPITDLILHFHHHFDPPAKMEYLIFPARNGDEDKEK